MINVSVLVTLLLGELEKLTLYITAALLSLSLSLSFSLSLSLLLSMHLTLSAPLLSPQELSLSLSVSGCVPLDQLFGLGLLLKCSSYKACTYSRNPIDRVAVYLLNLLP